MLKRIAPPLCALLILAGALPAVAAPAAVGTLAGAPNPAQAHFVAAEVDARAGNYDLARQELGTAESLDPALAAHDPRGVSALQQQLRQPPFVAFLHRPITIRGHRSANFGLFLILVAAAAVLWLILRRRAVAMGYIPPAGPQGYGAGNGPAGAEYGVGGYPGGYVPGGRNMAGAFAPPAAAPAPDTNADTGGKDLA